MPEPTFETLRAAPGVRGRRAAHRDRQRAAHPPAPARARLRDALVAVSPYAGLPAPLLAAIESDAGAASSCPELVEALEALSAKLRLASQACAELATAAACARHVLSQLLPVEDADA
jgi:hypothetical protein